MAEEGRAQQSTHMPQNAPYWAGQPASASLLYISFSEIRDCRGVWQRKASEKPMAAKGVQYGKQMWRVNALWGSCGWPPAHLVHLLHVQVRVEALHLSDCRQAGRQRHILAQAPQ